jgi:hypothetical protein
VAVRPSRRPYVPSVPRVFEDPAALQGPEEQRLALFGCVRDELRAYLGQLVSADERS